MSERVFFAEVGMQRARADALFASVEARVRSLLPSAFVEHVGSTSLPDGLTKGDLDVQIRVHADEFEEACRLLSQVYEENPGGFTDDGRSYKDDATEPRSGSMSRSSTVRATSSFGNETSWAPGPICARTTIR